MTLQRNLAIKSKVLKQETNVGVGGAQGRMPTALGHKNIKNKGRSY